MSERRGARELVEHAVMAEAHGFDVVCISDHDLPWLPGPERDVDAVREYLDAGFRNVSIVPVGDDVEGTLRFWADEVRPTLAA